MNATFKQTQLLPALTSEIASDGRTTTTFFPQRARPETREKRAGAGNASCQLPRPHADKSRTERALFTILALSAIFGLGWVVTMMIELSPNWAALQTWVARLAG